jgi:hypothetical protein
VPLEAELSRMLGTAGAFRLVPHSGTPRYAAAACSVVPTSSSPVSGQVRLLGSDAEGGPGVRPSRRRQIGRDLRVWAEEEQP